LSRGARIACTLAVYLTALGFLAGCGFRPLYGTPQYDILPELAAIQVSPIADRIGQQLRNMLYDRLTPDGEPKRPRYTLRVRVTTTKKSLGIQEDETVTRANLGREPIHHQLRRRGVGFRHPCGGSRCRATGAHRDPRRHHRPALLPLHPQPGAGVVTPERRGGR
jgi:hypothetical protein